MSDARNSLKRVTVEVDMSEPDLAAAAFQLMLTLAKAHNLPDVQDVRINLSLSFEGRAHEIHVSAFRKHLHGLWLDTRVTNVETLDESGHGKHVEVD